MKDLESEIIDKILPKSDSALIRSFLYHMSQFKNRDLKNVDKILNLLKEKRTLDDHKQMMTVL